MTVVTHHPAVLPTALEAAPPAECIPLNAADRLMLAAHRTGRELGHPGFWCQTHVWMDGRMNVPALRTALARLGACHPVLTARLDDPGGRTVPSWRFRPAALVTLDETDLPAAEPGDVWRAGAALNAAPLDHDRSDPVSFHLLHLPDGRDVLILRYSHVLMDGKAPEYALAALNECFDRAPPPMCSRPVDEMREHLDRFDAATRRRAALRVIRSHIRPPTRPVTLAPPARGIVVEPVRIRVATLDADRTTALTNRVRTLCGFANLTPAVVAAAFRAVGRLTGHRTRPRTPLQVDVPLNLRPPGVREPIFRNFMTFVQLNARCRDLRDRDALTRGLHGQMRDQLRRGIDLGNLAMMAFMAPRAPRLRKHIIRRALRRPFTLGFGFLGPVLPALDRFGGRTVEWLYTLNAAISPPGITLEVNQHRGRLNLILTYIDGPIPDPLAADFLDFILDDLGS